ncbi:MAG: SAM-dependent chlorinase/fluorinase [Chitinophagales bacterium]|nr:SAM-dependent chlorinase/fluorinase [Chitinophagales bacterium]MDW8419571.1 SAM-dependent chlorinase/fluorinase [Chitinophagales bacterium]
MFTSPCLVGNSMSVITLISDLGTRDYYVAAIKASIFRHCEKVVPIVDITHAIRPFDIKECAFTLKNALRYFSNGSIHVAHILSGKELLVAEYAGGYIVTFNNGLLSLMDEKREFKVYEVNEELTEDHSLLMNEAIGRVVNLLVQEYRPSDFAQLTTNYEEYRLLQPVFNPGIIRGTVVKNDAYGNAITNITRELFERLTAGKRFVIHCGVANVETISRRYGDVAEGDVAVLFNEADLLEIAINRGRADNLLALTPGSSVQVVYN